MGNIQVKSHKYPYRICSLPFPLGYAYFLPIFIAHSSRATPNGPRAVGHYLRPVLPNPKPAVGWIGNNTSKLQNGQHPLKTTLHQA